MFQMRLSEFREAKWVKQLVLVKQLLGELRLCVIKVNVWQGA
jgi:hypothetical protein